MELNPDPAGSPTWISTSVDAVTFFYSSLPHWFLCKWRCAVAEQHSLKSSGYAVEEVLPSSCVIAEL